MCLVRGSFSRDSLTVSAHIVDINFRYVVAVRSSFLILCCLFTNRDDCSMSLIRNIVIKFMTTCRKVSASRILLSEDKVVHKKARFLARFFFSRRLYLIQRLNTAFISKFLELLSCSKWCVFALTREVNLANTFVYISFSSVADFGV